MNKIITINLKDWSKGSYEKMMLDLPGHLEAYIIDFEVDAEADFTIKTEGE